MRSVCLDILVANLDWDQTLPSTYDPQSVVLLMLHVNATNVAPACWQLAPVLVEHVHPAACWALTAESFFLVRCVVTVTLAFLFMLCGASVNKLLWGDVVFRAPKSLVITIRSLKTSLKASEVTGPASG